MASTTRKYECSRAGQHRIENSQHCQGLWIQEINLLPLMFIARKILWAFYKLSPGNIPECLGVDKRGSNSPVFLFLGSRKSQLWKIKDAWVNVIYNMRTS